jgi:hypothetical protein
MDDVFKKKLAELRSPASPRSFAEALLKPGLWSLIPTVRPSPVAIKIHEEYSEKVQVIESLERFAQEKVKDSETGVFEVPGGQIALKTDESWKDVSVAGNLLELHRFLSLDEGDMQILLQDKKPGKIRVLFVTESSHKIEGDRVGFQKEIGLCFPSRTVEYFEKIITAMKLTASEIILYPIEKDDQILADDVMALATFYRPSVIVTFGAKAAHGVLKNNDRLQLFQGQFFKRTLAEGQQITVVPLFHPTIFENNFNMKKITWDNMQKIMEFLKNLQ